MPHQTIETRSAARLLVLFGLMAAYATIHILQHRHAMRQRHPQPVYDNHRRQRSQSRRRRRGRRGDFYDRARRDSGRGHDWDAWEDRWNEPPNDFYEHPWDDRDDEFDGRTVVSGMDRPPAPAMRQTWEDGDDEGSTLVDEPIYRHRVGRRGARL